MVLVAVEAGWRAWRRSPPGDIADRLEGILLVMLVIAIAGGLGLLVGGARPQELLHFVYAILVLSALPIAGTLTKEASPRSRGLASVVGALVALVVVARLFGTG
jgi:predicted membrane channel-forming protein YqfA (hemolysin III family)